MSNWTLFAVSNHENCLYTQVNKVQVVDFNLLNVRELKIGWLQSPSNSDMNQICQVDNAIKFQQGESIGYKAHSYMCIAFYVL